MNDFTVIYIYEWHWKVYAFTMINQNDYLQIKSPNQTTTSLIDKSFVGLSNIITLGLSSMFM